MTSTVSVDEQTVRMVSISEESFNLFISRARDAVSLREALREYEEWASRMPDADFTEDDPRWAWWHQRPFIIARAALSSVPETTREAADAG